MSVMEIFADGAVVAKRNVIKIKRVPEVLVFVMLSPLMFVLLFAFVFGASIQFLIRPERSLTLRRPANLSHGSTSSGCGIHSVPRSYCQT